MYLPEQPRRKPSNVCTLKTTKNSNSHNALISTLDRKRSDLSKEKVKITQMPEQHDLIDNKGSAVLAYRTNKGQPLQGKQKDFYQLKINRKGSNSEVNPIQVNLNIQNIIPNHHRKHNDTERSLSKTRKEEPKVKHNKREKTLAASPFDQFECCEELEFKPERKTEKKVQPLIDKSPRKDRTPLLKPKEGNVNDHQREIRQFQVRLKEEQGMAQAESVCMVDERQLCYQVDPLYIEKKQKHLNWTMRAILVEWMIHISYEFRLKRETLHIALTLVDNFFQNTTNLAKAQFQLTGAAALFVAAKLQEFEPLSSKQFAKSTKERYSAQEIKAMQCKIVKTLKYNLNPPTINMWANKLMQQWDLFLEASPNVEDCFPGQQIPFFKRLDEDSYKNYRQVMQILDCSMMDIQTVQYRPKILASSVLYLILGKECGEFNKKKIISEFPRTSIFFLEESRYNALFRMFLEQCLGLNMFDLLPSVQYLATYFILPMTYQRPCLKVDDENVEEMHLEEYCSYQTYNPNMLVTVRKRFRGIYQ